MGTCTSTTRKVSEAPEVDRPIKVLSDEAKVAVKRDIHEAMLEAERDLESQRHLTSSCGLYRLAELCKSPQNLPMLLECQAYQSFLNTLLCRFAHAIDFYSVFESLPVFAKAPEFRAYLNHEPLLVESLMNVARGMSPVDIEKIYETKALSLVLAVLEGNPTLRDQLLCFGVRSELYDFDNWKRIEPKKYECYQRLFEAFPKADYPLFLSDKEASEFSISIMMLTNLFWTVERIQQLNEQCESIKKRFLKDPSVPIDGFFGLTDLSRLINFYRALRGDDGYSTKRELDESMKPQVLATLDSAFELLSFNHKCREALSVLKEVPAVMPALPSAGAGSTAFLQARMGPQQETNSRFEGAVWD